MKRSVLFILPDVLTVFGLHYLWTAGQSPKAVKTKGLVCTSHRDQLGLEMG